MLTFGGSGSARLRLAVQPRLRSPQVKAGVRGVEHPPSRGMAGRFPETRFFPSKFTSVLISLAGWVCKRTGKYCGEARSAKLCANCFADALKTLATFKC